MAKRQEIGTFWVGGALGWVEALCLTSMWRQGHRVHLFSYGRPQNVPECVKWHDAREIFDIDRIFVHQRTRTPSAHSDIFRMKMFQQTEMIWADVDFLQIKPLSIGKPYIFAPETKAKNSIFGNSVLLLPKESETLKRVTERFDEIIAGDHDYKSRLILADSPAGAFETGMPAESLDMYIAEFGPVLLTRHLKETGEDQYALPSHYFYPLGPAQTGKLVYDSYDDVSARLPEGCYGIHLWSTRFKNYLQHKSAYRFPNRLMASYIIQMAAKNRVNFLALPADRPHERIGTASTKEAEAESDIEILDDLEEVIELAEKLTPEG